MTKKTKSKLCIIVGTRPEIIKMAPIIRYCVKRKLDYCLINTSQHYDYAMSKVFFKELKLPKPHYTLFTEGTRHEEVVAKMVPRIGKVLAKEKPGVVLVEGDTNTVLAGAIAASRQRIPVGHVEAGLRSHDRRMPEETNRILTDHLADFLFVPTKFCAKNLAREEFPKERIFVVGNTVVDAVRQNLKLAKRPVRLEKELGCRFSKGKYVLVTAHRAENVDVKKTLKEILEAFARVYKKYKMPIIFPIHPRTQKMIKRAKLSVPEGTYLTTPIKYSNMLYLLKHARLALTDSGGVQEESCVLGVPCVTLRLSTERPETVYVGSNLVAGTHPAAILKCVNVMLKKRRQWKNPFGDGKTGETIVKILLQVRARERKKNQ